MGRLDHNRQDQVSHIQKDGMTEGSNMHRISLLEAVEIECATDSLNQFGLSQNASLTVRCETAQVTWVGKKKSENTARSRSENGGTLIYTLSSTLPETSPLTADFELDVPDEDMDVSIGDPLLLLYVIMYQFKPSNFDRTVTGEIGFSPKINVFKLNSRFWTH
jgi:hypothetical protein